MPVRPRADTAYARAQLAAQRGDTAATLTRLVEALAQGTPDEGTSIHTDLMLAPLWDTSRFRELLRPQE